MSASDNLSLQLFRGFNTSKVKKPLGIHWSGVSGLPDDSPGLGASLFASPSEGEKHTIVHAWVNHKNVVNAYDTDFYKKHDIWGGGHPEFEEPVYPGSKVAVQGVTKVRKVKGVTKTRHVNYNPPREMKA